MAIYYLFGYDVSGHAYILRLEGLLVGMILCMIIFYKNQKNRPYRRKFSHLFQEFNIHSARSRWYIKLTFIVSSAMLIMSLLGLPRAMWAGIACMSVCLPFTNDCVARSGKRWMFNIVGGLLFVVLYTVLPESMYAYIGIIGGIGDQVIRQDIPGRQCSIHLERFPLRPVCLECHMQ